MNPCLPIPASGRPATIREMRRRSARLTMPLHWAPLARRARTAGSQPLESPPGQRLAAARRASPARRHPKSRLAAWWICLLALAGAASAQTLINVDFGVGARSAKTGLAGTGQSTNDFWNLYRHYEPRFTPGTPLVADGRLEGLTLADGAAAGGVSVTVSNGPGVWGNASGDPMFDTYVFAPNGSNLVVTLRGLRPGSYYFYLYGHADADVLGEQNSVFSLRIGTNRFGPLTTTGAGGWRTNTPMREHVHYAVFRDIQVPANTPVLIDVAPTPNGVAVLNGLQVFSRGTSPPRLPAPAAALAGAAPPDPRLTNLVFREVHYAGRVSDHEARFAVTLQAESFVTNEVAGPLVDGDVALLATDFPAGARVVSGGRRSQLVLSAPGRYTLQFDLLARIAKAEPWNQVSFVGPPAAIASFEAQSEAAGVELQLLNGTQTESTNASRVSGAIGSDRVVALRWQSKTAEITRKPLLTVDTDSRALVKPTGIEYTTVLRYEILQAPAARLTIELPAGHSLTRLQGPQIRDWQVRADGGRQVLAVEFIKPLERTGTLTLFSEQGLPAQAAAAVLVLPQPLEVQRETGTLTLAAEEMAVDIQSAPGLHQVNAPSNTVAAFRFFGRPATVAVRLQRFEPIVKAFDRVTARLEENRLLVVHALTLSVERAGVYALDLVPQPGPVVAHVRGEGIEDWKVAGEKLHVSFGSRVLGTRRIEVHLEQPHKTFPGQIRVSALRVTGATNETAQVGAASALGIRLKTAAERVGLREIPVGELARAAGGSRGDELLAFRATQPDWGLVLAAERLPARVVAEVFNLITIGDGLVGGSATIRYGIVNQGVREFRVSLPAHWRNVEFIGPNIRRRERVAPEAGAGTNRVQWALSLQDKAWGGYTLVVTYDYPFDPQRATLDLGGAHVEGVERETGSVAITSADRMELEMRFEEPLRQIDPVELAESDRALITRTVLRAYRYAGAAFTLAANLTRHDDLRFMLNAVADRTQLTSVLTDEGQMLSQASFMVKNNDKQFQRFRLPSGAELYGCYVNRQPVRAEKDGDWLLVSLPREPDRDEAFAVDIKYKQSLPPLKDRLLPARLNLQAPRSDVPNTYAEWTLYVPSHQRLSSFAGTMTVARGTTYGLRDGWRRFVEFYAGVCRHHGVLIALLGGGAVLLLALIAALGRRGVRGVVAVLGVLAILALAAGMLLPSLAKSKAKSQRVNSISNLKQIGLAARIWADDNGGVFPANFEHMREQLASGRILNDPDSGERYVWLGAGKRDGQPRAILAYSPVDHNGRNVLFADGSVSHLTSQQFAEAIERDRQFAAQAQAPGLAPAQQLAVQQRQEAPSSQPAPRPPAVPPPAPPAAPPQAAGPVQGASSLVPPAQPGRPPLAAPVAAGIRSIPIDIPIAGQAYTFTKVLNIGDEPLSVSMRATRLRVVRAWRASLQLAGLLVGLGLVIFEWRRRPTRSLPLAVGLALIAGAIAHWLISARVLHSGLIVGAPLLVLALLAWLFAKCRPRRQGPSTPQPPADPNPPGGGTAPAASNPAAAPVAGLMLLAGLMPGWAQTAAQKFQDPAPRLAKSQLKSEIVAIPPRFPQATIVSAVYTGTVGEKAAQFEAVLEVAAYATNQIVGLFGDDVALAQCTTDARDATLLRDGASVSLRLPDRTNATVKARFLVRLAGDVTRRQLMFAIPPALASRLDLTIDEEDADVDFPAAVTFRRSVVGKTTRVEAVLGAGGRVELGWTPRMKRATDVAASVFVQNTSLVSVGGGVVNTRTRLDYQLAQGELRQAKVRLPSGHRLLRVEGDAIRLWELQDEAAGPVLIVQLVKPAAPAYQLTLESEKPLEPLPASLNVAVPHALEVLRETGVVGLRGAEELSLAVESAANLQRIDAGELARALAVKSEDVLSAYRFLKPDFRLAARAEAVEPQIEAVVHNATRVGFDQVTLTARVEYTIKKAGVFTLRLALPDAFNIVSVSDDRAPLSWTETPNPRTVEVALKERAMGALALRLHLSQTHRDVPAPLSVAGVLPLGVAKLTGYVSVTAEPGLALKTDSFEGLTEIPPVQLPAPPRAAAASQARNGAEAASDRAAATQQPVLAFKSIGTDPVAAGRWRLSLSPETVESWVRVEVVNVVSVSETLLSGRSVLRYDIQNAPLQEFRVATPPGWRNVEVYGAEVRRRDETNGQWRVELQHKVRGAFTLTFTWEQPRPPGTNAPLELPALATIGTERETGWLVVQSRPALQLTEHTASDTLVRIDARELPPWAGVPGAGAASGSDAEVPVLAYRYLRPGYRLAVESRRFDEAAVLQALVNDAQLTTVVAEDGQMMTEMVLTLRTHGLQHLVLDLPPKARVWSAFVGGQPVRPSLRAGQLLLPLERATAEAVAVELTYVQTGPFPRSKGRVTLASPSLAAPLMNARWELYLPLDYEYTAFRGSMTHDDATPPAVQGFSAGDYVRQQKAKQVAVKSEFTKALLNVRSQLARGNVKDANFDFNQAFTLNSFVSQNQPAQQELDSLKRDLSRVQGSNLIEAQRRYTYENVGKLAAKGAPAPAEGAQQAAQTAQLLQYDEAAAARQVGALQKAQEVTAAKVQPLRANLPTRGQRHVFSQVLQTEVGKPMTLEFTARNLGSAGWLGRLAAASAAFLGLWILAAFLASHRRNP
ncbi:MAG: hypothetical protein JXQ71_11055 [Verrucomicrobia bacterium]|nr:hypothetical protein [Verrucomicrobiota bacterium]